MCLLLKVKKLSIGFANKEPNEEKVLSYCYKIVKSMFTTLIPAELMLLIKSLIMLKMVESEEHPNDMHINHASVCN